MLDFYDKLEVFCDFLECTGDIGFYKFDSSRRLVSAKNSDPEVFSHILSISGCLDLIWNSCDSACYPMIISDNVSLTWLAVPHKVENIMINLYVVGPTLPSTLSENDIRNRIRNKSSIAVFKRIPVISYQQNLQFGVLLFYILYNKKIEFSDIRLLSNQSSHLPHQEDNIRENKRTGYVLQQEIFQAVSDGNTSYVHPQSVLSISVGNMSVSGPLRQYQNMMISFITLISKS